jgi:hypothetical protein
MGSVESEQNTPPNPLLWLQKFFIKPPEFANGKITSKQNNTILPRQHVKNFQYINLIGLAYKLSDKEKFKEAKIAFEQEMKNKDTDDRWEILCTSQKDDGSLEHGYKAIAFINKKSKNIHIATAGTDTNNKYDLFDDIILCLDDVTISEHHLNKKSSKESAMRELMDKVLKQVNSKDYNFSTSGHSLGAAMSDLTALHIKLQDLCLTESITFENPGSKNWLTRYNKSNGEKIDLADIASKCITYNARPNFINTSANQVFAPSAQFAEKLYVVSDTKLGASKGFFDNIPLSNFIPFFILTNNINRQEKKIHQHLLAHFQKAQFINEVDGNGEKWGPKQVPLKISNPELLKLILEKKTPKEIKKALENLFILDSAQQFLQDDKFNILYPEKCSYDISKLDLRRDTFVYQNLKFSDDQLIVYNNIEKILVGDTAAPAA